MHTRSAAVLPSLDSFLAQTHSESSEVPPDVIRGRAMMLGSSLIKLAGDGGPQGETPGAQPLPGLSRCEQLNRQGPLAWAAAGCRRVSLTHWIVVKTCV